MKNHVLCILLLIVATSCTDSHEPMVKTGSVQIALRANDKSTGRGPALTDASAIFITIQDDRQVVVVDKKISLVKLNGDYITESILLKEGNYTVTRFLVLDDQDDAIYGTPIQGSNGASQVDEPLPFPFVISPDQPTSLPLTVVTLNSSSADDIGYASFSIKYKCALSATVNNQSLCYEGSRYLIAYASAAGQPSVFSLSTNFTHTSDNSIQWLSVETTEFTGPGTYTLREYNGGPEYSTYGSFAIQNGDKASFYYSASGTLVVESVKQITGTTNGLATGTFTMTAKDGKGNTVTVTGSFSNLRGMGWWD